jgi:hypothetical protein
MERESDERGAQDDSGYLCECGDYVNIHSRIVPGGFKTACAASHRCPDCSDVHYCRCLCFRMSAE